MQPLQICIGLTIRISGESFFFFFFGGESCCLPYAGFFNIICTVKGWEADKLFREFWIIIFTLDSIYHQYANKLLRVLHTGDTESLNVRVVATIRQNICID